MRVSQIRHHCARRLPGLSCADCSPQSIAKRFLPSLNGHARMLLQAPRRVGERPLPWLELRVDRCLAWAETRVVPQRIDVEGQRRRDAAIVLARFVSVNFF
jgi:hypothetical protein